MSHGLLADSVDTTLASLLYSCTTDALCCSMKCTISERAEKDVRSWRAKQHVHSFTRPICKQEVVLLHAVWSALSAILHVVLPPSVCLSLCTVTLCIVALRVGILGAESCTVVFLAGIFLFPSWDTFDVECSTAVFFTVGTDVVQPLLLWSSFGRWPCVCPCRSRCAWIVVTSHAGHMIEICQSTCRSAGLEQCPFGSPPLSICPDFVYGLSWLHSRSFSTLTSQELLTLSFVFPWVSKFLSYKVHCVSEKNAQTLKRYSSKL